MVGSASESGTEGPTSCGDENDKSSVGVLAVVSKDTVVFTPAKKMGLTSGDGGGGAPLHDVPKTESQTSDSSQVSAMTSPEEESDDGRDVETKCEGGESTAEYLEKEEEHPPPQKAGARTTSDSTAPSSSSSSSSGSSSGSDPFHKYFDDYLLDSSDSDEFEMRDQGLEVCLTTDALDGDGGGPEFHLPDPENECAPVLSKRASSIQSAATGDTRDAELKAGIRPDGKPTPVEEAVGGRGSPPKVGAGVVTGHPIDKRAAASSATTAERKGTAAPTGGSKVKRSTSHRKKRGSRKSGEANDVSAAKQKMSYYEMAKLGYKELVHAIIRPPRADYREEALGPPAFVFCGRRFTRTDFGLPTKRGLTLRCSHWEPVDRSTDRIPVVIYMHGNSSARVEVVPQLSYLLSLGVAVFSFDFAGSGKSDGDYVSLGYYEREDLTAVISHLRSTGVVSTIALWGRSMGAATALMHGDRDPSIACMILDSPFADLTQLAEEMVEKGREQGITVPNIVVTIAIRMIRGSVKKKAEFDIKKLSPIKHADKCFIPALFVAGEHDDFIDKRHSEAIHERYAGDKNLIVVEGDHNSPRPRFMFDSASIFLRTCLQLPERHGLKVPPGMNLLAPPWCYPRYPGPKPGSPQRPGTGGGGGARSPRVSPSKPQTMLSPGRPEEQHQHQQQQGDVGVEVTRQPQQQRSSSSRGSSRTSFASGGGGNNAGFDSDRMGVTRERQREIQASLFKMLGQADDDDAETRQRKQAEAGPPPPGPVPPPPRHPTPPPTSVEISQTAA